MKADFIISMDKELLTVLEDVAERHGLTLIELSRKMIKVILLADALEVNGLSLMVRNDKGELASLDVFDVQTPRSQQEKTDGRSSS